MIVSPNQIKYFGLGFKELLERVIREKPLICSPETALYYQAANAFKRRYGVELSGSDISDLTVDFNATAWRIISQIDKPLRPDWGTL